MDILRRPREIRLFEALMLTGVAIGLVQLGVAWSRLGVHLGYATVAQLVGLGLTVLLTLLVSRRASRPAKWILILLFLLALLAMLLLKLYGVALGYDLVALLRLLLELIALLMLFTRPAIVFFDQHKPSSV